MVRAWYPRGVHSAADRLRYYASHFNTVEVDSTFYGLPTAGTAELWAQRTPPGFVFHIKAFAMLTRHGVRPEQLPASVRKAPFGRCPHQAHLARGAVFRERRLRPGQDPRMFEKPGWFTLMSLRLMCPRGFA